MGIAIITLENCRREEFVCLVFGLGLIGSCVAQLLSLRSIAVTTIKTVDWSNVDTLLNAISNSQNYWDKEHIEVVWSAGHGGFSATLSEMEKELSVYKEVIGELNRKKKGFIIVNLISSAGGLYEGQRYIDAHVKVNPCRPYGFSKLKQEQFLIKECIKHRIYRVASAYGAAMHKSRIGLVNTLLINSIIGRTTQIFAKADTFRDYILNYDIARLIVDDVLYSRSNRIKIVCSGRAVSIQTLVNMISHIVRKKIKVTYVPNKENDEDMVFSRRLVPENLMISSLEEGIRMVHASHKFTELYRDQ